MSTSDLRSLLEAAVKALQSPLELVSGGRPNVRYPCDRQGQRVPLWLRLHHNRLGDGRGPAQVRAFLQGMEHELLAARRQAAGNIPTLTNLRLKKHVKSSKRIQKVYNIPCPTL